MDIYLDPEAELLRQVEEGKASSAELTAAKIAQAIQQGMTNSTPIQPNGCCRIYVCVFRSYKEDTGLSLKEQRAKTREFSRAVLPIVADGSKQAGRQFQVKGHQVENAIYIGYDTNSGREYGQGQAVAAALKAIGLSAYVELVGD